MANLNECIQLSFSNFPEDVQLSILSFLDPSDITTFASTSKHFYSLCHTDAKLWFSLCHRRWASKTDITKWGSGQITYKRLYKALSELENLVGFWRRSGHIKNSGDTYLPPLVFFEWGPSFITGSRVSPSKKGDHTVVKAPFLWICLSPKGENLNFLDPDSKVDIFDDLVNCNYELGFIENELIPVSVNCTVKFYVVVEEDLNFSYPNSLESRKIGVMKVPSSGNLRREEIGVVENVSGSPGSLNDGFTSEMYQYFANRTSPGGDRWSRRQRRREKERQGKRKWEPEHFVKIVNCVPTPSRPLQGLWKGIGEDIKLDFYYVEYDDIGGIFCRKVEDSSIPFSSYATVFWTSDTTSIESPFSPEEQYIYDSRIHLRPPEASDHVHGRPTYSDNESVSHILYINSSYDLVIPNLVETTVNPRQVEGRIWQYRNGTFGFGFLRDNHIVDLKHIAKNDSLLLDIIELRNN